MQLHGKIAAVTGSAHRLGRAISLALAREGADLAIHYFHSTEQAEALAGEIRALGRKAATFRADLAAPEQIEAMFAAVQQTFGRVDVLVNNAAVYDATAIETLTAEQWDAQLAVNARAAALCIRHAAAMMPDGGAIINIADSSAEKGRAKFPAYCASKAALLALTKSCALALAGRNIRVNAVSPGVAMWEEETGKPVKQRVLSRVPLHKPGGAESIAQAALFLIADDYITAQNLRVDGGWHMG